MTECVCEKKELFCDRKCARPECSRHYLQTLTDPLRIKGQCEVHKETVPEYSDPFCPMLCSKCIKDGYSIVHYRTQDGYDVVKYQEDYDIILKD